MSVRPVAYDPTGGVTVVHDDAPVPHGGAVAFAEVRFGRAPDGSVDPETLELGCPVCGAGSCHPLGGGADPPRVQKLFLRIWLRRAALPALAIPASQRTFVGVKGIYRTRLAAREGLAHWRLERMAGEDDDPDD